jgi:ATP-binding protein involved in chromosome partitioning
MIDQQQIEAAIKTYIDPHLTKDLIAVNAVKGIQINNELVIIDIQLGYPNAGYAETLKKELTERVKALNGVQAVQINLSNKIVSHAVQQGVKPLEGVKNIIAVASGKGGVGKSTTAVNLALALQLEGAAVGLLDADIYGPSQPKMLGVKEKPQPSLDGTRLMPVMGHGLQSMSIGYMIDEETPMIWRGPMVTQALEQLLRDTKWDNLDYLIIDLPPGTGDTQLTLAQKIPVSGAVIVTTPQDIALLDARKGLKMFEKVHVPVLGIVENMSIHICSKCGHADPIFGEGGGQKMATETGVELLAALPLDTNIRRDSDDGRPTVLADIDGRISSMYRDIARKVAAKLSLQTKNYAAKFPTIRIENK